eukprot:m.106317 g.106317  ORF g.106317 m.106317 type:complete len:185 (+) comp13298_c0_seq2:1337-1891(+)
MCMYVWCVCVATAADSHANVLFLVCFNCLFVFVQRRMNQLISFLLESSSTFDAVEALAQPQLPSPLKVTALSDEHRALMNGFHRRSNGENYVNFTTFRAICFDLDVYVHHSETVLFQSLATSEGLLSWTKFEKNWDTIKASSQRDATKMDALTEAARYFKFFTGGERTMDEKQFGRVFADLTET